MLQSHLTLYQLALRIRIIKNNDSEGTGEVWRKDLVSSEDKAYIGQASEITRETHDYKTDQWNTEHMDRKKVLEHKKEN